MSYNYRGQLHHNLNKYDIVVGLEIPDFTTVSYYTPFSTEPQYCKQWDDTYNINNKVLHETCTKVWPAYLATITKLDHARERINHIMAKEIPTLVPNFELKPIESEPTTTTYFESRTTAYPKRIERFTADLISLGIQGFTAFNTLSKQKQLEKKNEEVV